MGVNTHPFLGLGYMLRQSDMEEAAFDLLYEDLIDKYSEEKLWVQDLFYCKNLSVCSDIISGRWIFIGEWMYGDDEEIVKMSRNFMGLNGDDIVIELRRQLGPSHPFLEHATFGIYFGTDYS